MVTKQHEDAMDALLSLDPKEIQRLAHERMQERLTREEYAKLHPLSTFRLKEEEFDSLCKHIHDGGGAVSDEKLVEELQQAIHDRDQQVFWRALVHLAKARLNIRRQMWRVGHEGGLALRGGPQSKK